MLKVDLKFVKKQRKYYDKKCRFYNRKKKNK